MADQPSRYGPALAALGGILLAVSVFLPWYGISFTAAGAAAAQQVGDQVVSQFGNAALQSYMSEVNANLGALAGHQFMAVSAHQVLHHLNVVLLIAAGLAIAIALLALAGDHPGPAEGNRPLLALTGALAAVCVLYRMIHPPDSSGGLLALSLREGAWLALFGSLAIVAGALWPHRLASRPTSQGAVQSAWSSLSGWTPEG